ncbi:MAG: SWIM zinc finger family protein [Gammaproteobacteria bacterium]
MSNSDLKAALAAFDENTLAALASKGLLRRAQRDLDSAKVSIEQCSDDVVVVQADGETVRMDGAGPASATCSCPAPGVCRHRIAAVLAFNQRGDTGSVMPDSGSPAGGRGETPGDESVNEVTGAAPAPSVDATTPAVAQLLALSRTAISRWAGAATMRAAGELLNECSDVAVELDGAALIVRLDPNQPTVRVIPGQALGGLISKATRARRKTLHTAAVLALRARFGDEDLLSPDGGQARYAATSKSAGATMSQDFLAAVSQCLSDCFRTGFNQAPEVLEERLFSLSVSSRADALPRLSSLLRTLAAHVRDKRARDFSLDVENFLSLLAETHVLITALGQLESARPDCARHSVLRGSARQSYDDAGTLSLYGMGAHAWQTGAGARGVTSYFYAPDRDRWFSASLARGHGHDTTFDARAAYANTPVWGEANLARLAQSKVELEAAQAAPDGRLSLARQVRATATPWSDRAQTVRQWPILFNDWARLEAHLQSSHALAVGRARTGATPVLLQPKATAKAYFAEIGQETVLPVQDVEGRWLALTVGHGPGECHRSEEILRASSEDRMWSLGALATARQRGFELEPYVLFTDRPGYESHSLGLDASPAASGTRQWLRRLGRETMSLTGLGPRDFERSARKSATERTLDEGFDALLALAELGGRRVQSEHEKRLESLAVRAASLELAPLGDALCRLRKSNAQTLPALALECVYIVDVMRSHLRTLAWLST